jgi:precorrin-6A/cobalt-precorrin-6A reductase
MRVLILGGTTEASAIARALAGDGRFVPVLSLAGRTRAPVKPPIPLMSEAKALSL